MKKTIILIAFTIVLNACATNNTKRSYQKSIKGNWTLSTISYDETGAYNIILFEDATKDCFESSSWQFVPNNNTGKYSIIDSHCLTGDRDFVFTIQEIDKEAGLYDLLLKPTNEKHKSETKKGFRLKLSSLTENVMQWQQTVIVEGKPFIISLNFEKS